jgi:DNA-binding NarL/FixJ family response regulator
MASKVLEMGKKAAPPRDGSSPQHRLFLIDDHAVMREGLRALLQSEHDLTICGEADTARAARIELGKMKPDLAIIDISLPGSDGLELIKNLKAQYPNMRMMVLSMHAEELYAERALRAGALGYIMKHAPVKQLLGAIRTVLRNEVYLSPQLSSRMLTSLASRKEKSKSAFEQLSDRELEILRLFGEGLSTREVATSLTISSKTVESHRGNIRRKLQLRTGSELIRYAVLNQESLPKRA